MKFALFRGRFRFSTLMGYVYLVALCYVFNLQYRTLTDLYKQGHARNLTRENSIIFFVDRLDELRGNIDCRQRGLYLAHIPGLWGDFFVEGLTNYALSPCKVETILEKPLARPDGQISFIVLHKSHPAYPGLKQTNSKLPVQLTTFSAVQKTDHYILLKRRPAP